jgi:hypothetical protein
MTDQPRSRDDVARRVAAYLGTKVRPELLEIVPPVGWEELATRAELRDGLRRHHDHIDRRLQGVRDALAVAYEDQVRRLAAWDLAVAGALVAAVMILAARVRPSSGSGATGSAG